MTPETVVNFGRQAMEMMLITSAPVLMVALVVGLVVSLFQAVTQINEATLSFLPKLVAVVITIVIVGPWMLTMLTNYIRQVIGSLATVAGG
jgi:flagellar biosynthesis protein FliQ